MHLSTRSLLGSLGFVALGLLAGCSALGISVEGQQPKPVITMAPPAPDLGPPPAEIPEQPDVEIVVVPGQRPLPPILREFVERQEGYVLGTGRLEGILQGGPSPLALLSWTQAGSDGDMTCRAATPISEEPGGWGCGSGLDDIDAGNTLGGFGYTTDVQGFQSIEVEHSIAAVAVVVERGDGTVIVIRPGDSRFSYFEWEGAPPLRFTVFWEDGTSTSEITS